MDTLTNIAVSLPDTIAIVATPKEVVWHSCHDAMPLGNVITICATIVICLLIIASATWKCFRKAQEVKTEEIQKKLEAEKKKRESEQNYKRHKDQYDSAWRTFEYILNGKLPDGSNDAGIEAKEYIKFFWGHDISDVNKDTQS